jgi:hypothetical protein
MLKSRIVKKKPMEAYHEYQWVTVRTYTDRIFADLIANELKTHGVETYLANTSNVLIIPGDRIELKVKESDVDFALEIIEEQEGL